MAPAFTASADFAIDKPAGTPCPNLDAAFRCTIHETLRPHGFPGCVAYDCFGAGQKVTQLTFAGRDWRRNPEMLTVFGVMRQLHELLWCLTEALAMRAAAPLHAELTRALDETERLTRQPSEVLCGVDLPAHRRPIGALLRRASTLARTGTPRAAVDHRRADLIGKDLRGADLHGADLHAAFLIGADLSGADLRAADLLGTDLRAANLSGADLTGALFLTQSQLDAATGDHTATLPPTLTHPAHWRPRGL